MVRQIDVDTLRKTACRYCDSPLQDSFLDLGAMPLANSFPVVGEENIQEFICPLSLSFCPVCGLVQLTHAVPSELMFSNYLYVSSTTKTFQEHFRAYAKAVKARLFGNGRAFAVDIGSNDGLLLACFEREGIRAVGVEPAKNLSDGANEKGLVTLNRYFDSKCVEEIIPKYGRADIVTANNVFAHVDQIQDLCQNAGRLLDDQGMFILEFPYLVTMVEQMFFDMIYHEHLSYISVTALDYLIRRFGFRIFSIDRVPSHGGSLRVFMMKEGGPYTIGKEGGEFLKEELRNGYQSGQIFSDFSSRVKQAKEDIIHAVHEIKREGKTISGYGAPAKATTLINYCGLNRSQIDFVVDDNPLKQNRLIPGAKVSIVSHSWLKRHPTDYVIIFAWNFADEIMGKMRDLREKGIRFIIPLPEVRIA